MYGMIIEGIYGRWRRVGGQGMITDSKEIPKHHEKLFEYIFALSSFRRILHREREIKRERERE